MRQQVERDDYSHEDPMLTLIAAAGAIALGMLIFFPLLCDGWVVAMESMIALAACGGLGLGLRKRNEGQGKDKPVK